MTRTNQKAYLIYDADCGRCLTFMKFAKCFDTNDALMPVPLQNDFSYALVGKRLSPSEMMRTFHLVEKETAGKLNLSSGGDGLLELLKYFPHMERVAPIAGKSPTLRKFANSFYISLSRLRGNACRRS